MTQAAARKRVRSLQRISFRRIFIFAIFSKAANAKNSQRKRKNCKK